MKQTNIETLNEKMVHQHFNPAVVFLTCMASYMATYWIVTLLTGATTYGILAGLAVTILVGFYLRRIKSEKYIQKDERVQNIVHHSWRAAYFGAIVILGLIGIYGDFIGLKPVGMIAVFPITFIGSAIIFLGYYYMMKNR